MLNKKITMQVLQYIKHIINPFSTKVDMMANYLGLVSLPYMAQPLDLYALRQIQARRYLKLRV